MRVHDILEALRVARLRDLVDFTLKSCKLAKFLDRFKLTNLPDNKLTQTQLMVPIALSLYRLEIRDKRLEIRGYKLEVGDLEIRDYSMKGSESWAYRRHRHRCPPEVVPHFVQVENTIVQGYMF